MGRIAHSEARVNAEQHRVVLHLTLDSGPEVRLGEVQAAHKDTSIGSYPRYDGTTFSTEIVIRARDPELCEAAAQAVEAMIDEIRQQKQASAVIMEA